LDHDSAALDECTRGRRRHAGDKRRREAVSSGATWVWCLGCSNRPGKDTRTTTCSWRTQRQTRRAATTAHGDGRRAAAAAQDRRTRSGATKRGDMRQVPQSAPHLHVVRLAVFSMAETRRRHGLKRRSARVSRRRSSAARVRGRGESGAGDVTGLFKGPRESLASGPAASGTNAESGSDPSSTPARPAVQEWRGVGDDRRGPPVIICGTAARRWAGLGRKRSWAAALRERRRTSDGNKGGACGLRRTGLKPKPGQKWVEGRRNKGEGFSV
jgi:hypothetical protein